MITLALCAALASASAPAPAFGQGALRVPHERFTLDNGLTVVIHEDKSVPRVHVSVRYLVGSSAESPGRTGFAHLFEHLMFEGSKHVPEGMFDRWLEAAGGENNAYTSEDETYYFEEVPAHALDLALFLESDRMGFFVDELSAGLVDGQRDVVKNERRQTVENRPWGAEEDLLPPALWPKGHPYSWSVIGSMADLSAATLDDVRAFFRAFYAPANAVLVIVGDVDTRTAKQRVQHWFSDVPARPAPARPEPAPARLSGERRIVSEDAHAPLAKLVVAWPSVAAFAPDDAALDVVADVLAGAASARLTKRLVHELQLAQMVGVSQHSMERAGFFEVEVIAQPDVALPRVLAVVDEELARLRADGPSAAEVARAQAKMETAFADALDGLSSKAQRLSSYQALLSTPDAFARDLERYRAITPAAVRDVASRHLGRGRVVLSLVPRGRLDLAVVNPSGDAR